MTEAKIFLPKTNVWGFKEVLLIEVPRRIMYMKHLRCPSQHLSVRKSQANEQTHENHNLKIAQVRHLNVLGMIRNTNNSQQSVLRVAFPLQFTALYSTG